MSSIWSRQTEAHATRDAVTPTEIDVMNRATLSVPGPAKDGGGPDIAGAVSQRQ
jgi:hypothetical protein